MLSIDREYYMGLYEDWSRKNPYTADLPLERYSDKLDVFSCKTSGAAGALIVTPPAAPVVTWLDGRACLWSPRGLWVPVYRGPVLLRAAAQGPDRFLLEERLCAPYGNTQVLLRIGPVQEQRSAVRSLEHSLQVRPLWAAGGVPVASQRRSLLQQTLDRIAITDVDWRDPSIPHLPINHNDSRSGDFRSAYGDEVVEVEALPPVALQKRLRQAIQRHRDKAIWARSEAQERRDWAELARRLR